LDFAQVIHNALTSKANEAAASPTIVAKGSTTTNTKSPTLSSSVKLPSNLAQSSPSILLAQVLTTPGIGPVPRSPVPAPALAPAPVQAASALSFQDASVGVSTAAGEAESAKAGVFQANVSAALGNATEVSQPQNSSPQSATASVLQTVATEIAIPVAAAATAAADALPPVPGQPGTAQETAATQKNETAAPETFANVKLTVDLVNSTHGTPISSLFEELQKVQSPATSSEVSISSSTAATASSVAVLPGSVKSSAASANLSLMESRDLAAPIPPVNPKLVLPVVEPPKVAPAPTANAGATTNHSESQESSTSAGGQSLAGANDTKDGASISRLPTDFSQSFATASVAKPDAPAAMVTPPPTVAVPAPPPAQTAANPAPAASAPPPPPPTTGSAVTAGDPTAIHFAADGQLMQTVPHSEMRIAMQTDKYGPIELHARVAGDAIGASITVEKRDAHAALALELPALQQALSDKQLRVDQVTLLHGTLSSTAGHAGAGSQQGERGQAHRGTMANFSASPESLAAGALITPEYVGGFDAQGRLSVLA
jgi:hypothetical protein